jgi:hypothetical protein
MQYAIEIEDIEGMRRLAGIDDVVLRQDIRALRRGDIVKLTFLAGPRLSECLCVRITRIRGSKFRGEVANAPACAALSRLRIGSGIAFTADHIHSLAARESSKRAP